MFEIGYGLPLSLFLAGLVGGATHCAGMCGPFVLSQGKDLHKLSQAALIPYHLGRITTYVGMAVLFASVFNLAFLFLPIRGWVIAPLLMLAGLFFMASAFPSLGKIFPWLTRISFSMPYQWIARPLSKISDRTDFLSKYFLGILLGFTPCGLIVGALMAAATAPTPFQAGLAMLAFGMGTMPALILIAVGGHYARGRYPSVMKKMTQGMMVWSAVWLFALAGFLLV